LLLSFGVGCPLGGTQLGKRWEPADREHPTGRGHDIVGNWFQGDVIAVVNETNPRHVPASANLGG
jgi:hypothetical protein